MRYWIMTLMFFVISITADDSQYAVATKLLREKEYAAARTLLESVYKSNPHSPKVCYALGYALEKTDTVDTAKEFYARAVLLNLDTGKDPQQAESAIKRLSQLQPAAGVIFVHGTQLLAAAEKLRGKNRKTVEEAAKKLLRDGLAVQGYESWYICKWTLPGHPHWAPVLKEGGVVTNQQTTGEWTLFDDLLILSWPTGFHVIDISDEENGSFKLWDSFRGIYRVRPDTPKPEKPAKTKQLTEKELEKNLGYNLGWAPRDAVEGPDGHKYKYFAEKVTWEEARKRCEKAGGFLVSVNTRAEWDLVLKILRDSGQDGNTLAWAGGVLKDKDLWLDGTPIDRELPQRWYGTRREGFLHVDTDGYRQGPGWGSYPGGKQELAYICEWVK